MIIPRDYQKEQSVIAAAILKEYMLVYLAWEERTGKSLTGILTVEQLQVKRVLVVTKKNAKKDWDNLLGINVYDPDKVYKTTKHFDVTTYGMAHKYDPDEYDVIILDESHNYISCYPKPSATWKKLVKLTAKKPILYMSATPHAQGYQMLYHQFALSTWSPWWRYSNFYNWFRRYGKPYTIKANGREVNQYDRVDDRLIKSCIDHLFITKTRKELRFKHEPKDKLHWIDLSESTKVRYNTLLTDKVLIDTPQPIIADTVMKLRSALHMLEGGVMKSTMPVMPENTDSIVLVEKENIKDQTLFHLYYELDNEEKIQYIKKTWGDTKDLAIMYNYKAEGIKLHNTFECAKILQATSNAEGIDLAHIKHLVVYSQDYSTARHTQRRARQASKVRDSEITVHFLLVKKAISQQVYNTVAINKKNYVDSRFEKVQL